MYRKWALIGLVAALVSVVGWQLLAQEQTRQPRRTDRGTRETRAARRPGAGTEQMRQFRQRMQDRLKQGLRCSDEEWKVIGPAVEKVQEAQQELRRYAGIRAMLYGGAARARSDRGGRTSGEGAAEGAARAPRRVQTRPEGELQRRAEDSPTAPLLKLLQKDKPGTEEIKAALKKFRAAREAKREELKKYQKFLQELVTPRQELVLVVAGILE